MSKSASEKQTILEVFKKRYGSLFTEFSRVQPQMPKDQIQYFLKQSVNKQMKIIIQINPTTHSQQINEYMGTVEFSPYSTQIILKTLSSHITYLLNAKDIRHVRLA